MTSTRSGWRCLCVRGAWLLLLCPFFTARTQAQTSADSNGQLQSAEPRPGLFKIGTFYLTPYLHIGTLGVDTNVFYTPTERQTDFTASGGPGLEIVKPFGRENRLRLDGGLDYLYFAKTDSQRRLNGYGTASVEFRGVKTRLTVEERYARTFARPNYEVNDRVEQETEGTQGFLQRNLGEQFRLSLFGSRQVTRTDGYVYLGTDLGSTLSTNEYHAGAELQLALSVKTRLVGGGDQAWYRFPELPARDGSSFLAYGGFRTDPTALIGGHALAGIRRFRLDSGADRNVVYADVSAIWAISPKTKLGGIYLRDVDYSSLAIVGPTPTNLGEQIEFFVEKFFTNSIYMRLFARQHRLVADGKVVIVPPEGAPELHERNDRIREAGSELGYQFRSRLRAAVTVSYTDRASTIETFGVEGLLAGFALQYNPPQPTFR